MDNIFIKDGEVHFVSENEIAQSVVNKIIKTLPPYSLKEFIYLLSLTISNERTGRLDALYGALELVDYETRVEMLVLFKEFGIEEDLIKDMVSYFSKTTISVPNEETNVQTIEYSDQNTKEKFQYRKSWPHRGSHCTDTPQDVSDFYSNKDGNGMGGYEDFCQVQSKKILLHSSPLIERSNTNTKEMRHRSMNDAMWKSREDNSFARDLNNIISEPKADTYIPPPRREKNRRDVQTSKKYSKKTRFTNEESKFIVSLVESSEITNWTVISKACNARFGGNKTGPQCHQHYFRVANSNISKNAWRQEEDELLKRLVHMHGHKWSQISQSLPGRPDTSCRRRWKTIQKNKTL